MNDVGAITSKRMSLVSIALLEEPHNEQRYNIHGAGMIVVMAGELYSMQVQPMMPCPLLTSGHALDSKCRNRVEAHEAGCEIARTLGAIRMWLVKGLSRPSAAQSYASYPQPRRCLPEDVAK